ncbi:MAG: hypothetical protein PH343_07055 [Nitrospira sp.]|nr:hypothetical protein [Nitrospira sp.]
MSNGNGNIIVAWVSQHKPVPAQIKELKRVLGQNIEVVEAVNVYQDAKEVMRRLKELKAQYAVLVLPLSVISHILQRDTDITMLRAEMEPVHVGQKCMGTSCHEYRPDTDALTAVTKARCSSIMFRHSRFKEFRVLESIEVNTTAFESGEEQKSSNYEAVV